MIISNKHGTYELPHELLSNLRLKILGNKEISGKALNFIELQPSALFYPENENFVNISIKLLQKINFSCSALFHIKTGVCPKYFLNGCLSKLFFPSNLPQTPLKFICLTIFVTLRPLTQFYSKVKATNIQKSAKIYFSR